MFRRKSTLAARLTGPLNQTALRFGLRSDGKPIRARLLASGSNGAGVLKVVDRVDGRQLAALRLGIQKRPLSVRSMDIVLDKGVEGYFLRDLFSSLRFQEFSDIQTVRIIPSSDLTRRMNDESRLSNTLRAPLKQREDGAYRVVFSTEYETYTPYFPGMRKLEPLFPILAQEIATFGRLVQSIKGQAKPLGFQVSVNASARSGSLLNGDFVKVREPNPDWSLWGTEDTDFEPMYITVERYSADSWTRTPRVAEPTFKLNQITLWR